MARGTLTDVRAQGKTRPARTFWWDRESRTTADELRAVIFDADSALPGIEQQGRGTDLIDAVMSLFVAGIWIGVVSARPRVQVETQVRHLLGDGLVETIVAVDDLFQPDASLVRSGELYRLALWEMGITPRAALAVAGSSRALRVSATAGLPAVLVGNGHVLGRQFAAAVLGYDGPYSLSAATCQHVHRRWWIGQAA